MKDSVTLPKYDECFTVAALLHIGQPAPSKVRIMRKFNIGFRRAERILSQLDEAGFISLKDNKVLLSNGKDIQSKIDSMDLGVQELYSRYWNQ